MPWFRFRLRSRQTEKAPGFVGDVVEIDKAAALADDVEEIAIFGRGGIGPMPGGAETGFRSAKPDEHRPAGRIANVAHQPVAALAPPVGQVIAAYRLGIARETMGQFSGLTSHGHAAG